MDDSLLAHDLLPCPFCKRHPFAPQHEDDGMRYPRCVNKRCKIQSVPFSEEEWQDRAPAPPSEGIRAVVDSACALHQLWGLPPGAERCAGVSLLADKIRCRFMAAVGNLKPIEREACGVAK